jgi:hypothetical protein
MSDFTKDYGAEEFTRAEHLTDQEFLALQEGQLKAMLGESGFDATLAEQKLDSINALRNKLNQNPYENLKDFNLGMTRLQ